MSWTDERVELLKKLWIDGLSASQIAAQLGGVTRNAVIGKVHRLNLSGRAKPASTTPRPRKAGRAASPPHRPAARTYVAGNTALKIHAHPAPRRVPSPVPIEDLVVPISLNVSLMDLNDSMCKWPIGDPTAENFCFCGHRNFNGLPYCEYHSRIAYQPVERRRDRRDRDY
ncbi:MAG: GcrA cell cycle regulator [Bauldia sp.]|nr:MAG: GcrA cell cycle regulator [Bauldia sp.]